MVERMPVVFLGHGSPMNAIENNEFTAQWEALGRALPRPRAILCVSAHWYTQGTRVTDAPRPRMVYDMFGFPEELYRVQYPALGAPGVAREALALLGDRAVLDNTWGIDHGAWSVLRRLFPAADVPVFQVSVDRTGDGAAMLALGQALAPLREQGVLLLGSGNVVHNLHRVDWNHRSGLPWADRFDALVRRKVEEGRFADLADPAALGPDYALAVPTPDHYWPLLAVLGAATPGERVEVFCEGRVLGSLSMTGYRFG